MNSHGVPPVLWLLSALLVGAGLVIYGFISRRVFDSGGRVDVRPLGPADLVAGSVLTIWFFSIVTHGFDGPKRPVQNSDLTQTAAFISLIVITLGSFLHFRKIRVLQLLGFHTIPLWRAAGVALGLLAAAYPLIGAASYAMERGLGVDADRQEIVSFFSEAARHSNFRTVIVTMLLGMVLAPIAEEFIFRGYLYGIFKRYFGMFAGTLLNAALFACFHLNLMSLPGLSILAICLTLAYELTGTIAVPMFMHAMFNSLTFAALLSDASLTR